MRIKVAPMYELHHPMVGGMSGLGQDDGGDIVNPDGSVSPGSGVTPLPDLPLGLPSTPLTIPNLTPTPSTPGYTGGGATTVSTPQGDFQVVNGQVFAPNGNISSLSALQSALGFPSSGGSAAPGPNLAQILSAAAASAGAAANIYRSTQTPSLIPGTNLVYNPATGQLSNALGVSASAIAPALSSISPLLILAVGAVLVISMLGKR